MACNFNIFLIKHKNSSLVILTLALPYAFVFANSSTQESLERRNSTTLIPSILSSELQPHKNSFRCLLHSLLTLNSKLPEINSCIFPCIHSSQSERSWRGHYKGEKGCTTDFQLIQKDVMGLIIHYRRQEFCHDTNELSHSKNWKTVDFGN